MSVDPRGLRFGAWITTAVLIVVLVTHSTALAAAQTAVFAAAALFGLRFSLYGAIFRTLVRPRLSPPRELEPVGPPRFAQAVGAAFAALATVGFGLGLSGLGSVAAAMALAAAFLNAAFGICLGCELYLSFARARGVLRPAAVSQPIREGVSQ